MSRWSEAEDILSDDMTDEFGDVQIRHIPMRRPDVNSRSEADPSRPVQSTNASFPSRPLIGIFDNTSSEIFLGKGHSESRAVPATKVSSSAPRLSIERRDFVSDVLAADLIAFLDRGTLYEVTDVQADGQGRVNLFLAQRGRKDPSL